MGKKRKLAEGQVEDLTFDPSARQEYLTGFHKRKQARIQTAREAAIKREKEERVKERKALREQRKEDLEQHVKAVNEELRKQNAIVNGEESNGEDEEWDGIEDSTAQAPEIEELPEDEEYVDEDKHTTVTVEAMGDEEPDEEDADGEVKAHEVATLNEKETKKRKPWAKGKTGDKPKKKKFRYESKAERQVTRQKQKSKGARAAKARREKG